MHNIDIDSVKDTLRIKRVHRVRNDYESAVKAQDSGIPLLAVSRHSPAAKDIQTLGGNLASSHVKESEDKKGLFSKLFGNAN